MAKGLLALLGVAAAFAQIAPAPLVIDYPADGSVFPPDMAAPTFLWRDAAANAGFWQIDISFPDGSAPIHVTSGGDRMQIGEIDERCVSPTNKRPELTPDQAAAHSWKPDLQTWAAIRQHSLSTITISGAGTRGRIRLEISRDPVGAPIFYRDVPLMPSEVERGVIKPLAASAVPLIAWRLRDVSSPASRVLMEDLHACANCHSFSADGKTLGLSLDGPGNDKGLFTLVPIQKRMSIRNQDVISWPAFRGQLGSEFREGFMPQVSPDGRRVVTTISPPNTPWNQFYYTANFKDYRFLQVFYPTRGILAWYDRDARKLHPLPGADDPRYAHTDPVWSPDGQYLVFARAEARDPYPAGRKMAEFPNDPAEVPMQYDLYRIPFNDGKGGVPEAIEGASHNGMSNSFPKISPDGRWLVFVQARNGQLLRPDSRLYIVPVAGGRARLMNCNTPLMNSWHSFSPNGRWLVFSSKSRSPYTQMFLTHIDAEGRDTPPILIENSTAANRAVNLPEFVNIPSDGIEHIDTPAIDFYRQFDLAVALAKKGDYAAAIPAWIRAIAMSSDDARAHNNFGLALAGAGRMQEAVVQYQSALAIKPEFPEAHNNLGLALAATGHPDEAMEQYRQAVEANPAYAEAQSNLGISLLAKGETAAAIRCFEAALEGRSDYPEAENNLAVALASQGHLYEAIQHYERALAGNPKYLDAHNNLGVALARQGNFTEAAVHFRKALELNPSSIGAESNLGRALLAGGKLDDAIPHFEKAALLAPGDGEIHVTLARAYIAKRQLDKAVVQCQRALDISPGMREARYYLGLALVASGRASEGLTHWREVLRSTPDDPKLLTDTAWLLATSRDNAVRNGKDALKMAGHAVQLTGGGDPMALAAMAAAYAETGQFDKAIDADQRAIDLAAQQRDSSMTDVFRARLAQLQAKRPIRD